MDKPTQKERLLTLFRDNGNMLSLGMIMKTDLADEWRARLTELRNDGYEIPSPVMDRKNPSNNLYTLIESKVVLKPVKPLKEKPTNTTDTYEDIKRRYIASSTEGRIQMLRDAQSKTPQNHREFVEIGKQISILSKGSGT